MFANLISAINILETLVLEIETNIYSDKSINEIKIDCNKDTYEILKNNFKEIVNYTNDEILFDLVLNEDFKLLLKELNISNYDMFIIIKIDFMDECCLKIYINVISSDYNYVIKKYNKL